MKPRAPHPNDRVKVLLFIARHIRRGEHLARLPLQTLWGMVVRKGLAERYWLEFPPDD